MLNRTESQPHYNIEMQKAPDGGTVATFAEGKIRVYEGHSPKTTIDVPEFNAHLVIHKIGPFEFNKSHEIEEVFVRKGHHKSHFAAAFSDKAGGEPYEYNVWSSDGIIGTAKGKRLDLLIASFFYNDPGLNEFIEDASMDETVKRHIKLALVTAGTRIHEV